MNTISFLNRLSKKAYIVIIFSFALFHANANGKYKKIDALLQTNSAVDAFAAMDMLKKEFAKDTVEAAYWLKYYEVASELYQNKEAENALTKAINIDPTDATIYYERARFYNDVGKLNQALQDFEKAVAFAPDNGEYYYWKGIINQQLNDNENALRDYAKALKNNFEAPEMYNNMAILFTEEGNTQEGMRSINKAIQLDDKYAEAYALRAKIYVLSAQIDEACKDASTAYSLNYRQSIIPHSVCEGNDQAKWEYVADINLSRKQYENAITFYTKLIENGGTVKSDYFLNRGFCYFNMKMYKQAESDYQKALTLPNANLDLLYDNLSLLYFNQDNYPKSIEYSTKRILLNPENHIAYLDRGLAQRKLKKYAEAEKDFKKSLAIRPDFFRAYGYRSFLNFELGKYEDAFNDATKAIEINPQYGYAYLVLAQVKQRMGNPDFCTDYQLATQFGEPEGEMGLNLYCK